jgi:1-acyl-sn-glycerol-3-phosphate acyltransferase
MSPHGIFPMTAFWSTRNSAWWRHYAGVHVDVLGASVMLYSPLLRDIVMWAGGRDVSKRSIRQAFADGRSVCLVPGGLREMRRSRARRTEMNLVTRHKGFVRIAIQCGKSLVPMLSFGEDQIVENIHAPRMQSWTSRVLGFGLPMWVHGRWYSPLPNRVKVTVAIGEPVPVVQEAEPSQSTIDAVHKRYYDTVRALFEAHKAKAGYPDMQLYYHDT